MGFFTIFFCTIKQNWRDRSTYLEMMLLPIVLIFILGMSLNPVFQTPILSPTPTAVLNEDTGPVGENFNRFLANEEVNELLDLIPVTTLEEGLRLVEEGEVHAMIHVPPHLLQKGENTIRLTASPHQNLRTGILESVLDSFAQGANTVMAMESMGIDGASLQFQQNHIRQRSLAASDMLPGAMDYYAVTMLVMFMMYGTTYAVFGMKECYLGPTGSRIHISPISRAQHYLGLVAANLMTVMFQGIIIVAFTWTVFGVNWGNNPSLILFLLLITATTAIGLGTAIVMITRDEILSGNIVNILVPAMTFLAGGFFRINPPPGSWMGTLQYLSPNYLAQTALFTAIYSGDTSTLLTMTGALGTLIIATFATALAAERRARS